MLRNLHIVNFAIIEDCSIELSDGANVFTGETGAGKSILVEALSVLTGKRARSDLIRTGADFFKVEGIFDCDEVTAEWLKNSGFDASTGDILISRKLSKSGHGSCTVNGDFCTIKQLQILGTMLLHLHGQHDTMELLTPSYCEKIIDSSSLQIKQFYSEYKKIYEEWRQTRDLCENFETKRQENERRIDILAWEIEQIQSAEIHKGEDEEIDKRLEILQNHEKIMESLHSALYAITSDNGVQDQLGLAEKDISRAASYDETLASAEENIRTAVFSLEDAIGSMESYVAESDFSQEELDELQSRSEILIDLKRKFGPTLEDVISYLEKAEQEYDTLKKMIYDNESVQEKMKTLYSEVQKKANELNTLRMEKAQPLIQAILSVIYDLGMDKAKMDLRIVPAKEPVPTGVQSMEFYLSVNPGEPLRPLRETASGGELSRIALGIEILIADLLQHKTLVFDEIDVGISGKIGLQVACKIKELSKKVQVLIVTHLPQTASIANCHYHIEKITNKDKTISRAILLDKENHIKQIAQMISGTTNSQNALKAAMDMIKLVNNT